MPHHDSGISLEISSQDDISIVFSVDISNAKPAIKNKYNLWVSVEGLDVNGEVATRTNQPVTWPGTGAGVAQFTKDQSAQNSIAFVWQFPDALTQLASLSF